MNKWSVLWALVAAALIAFGSYFFVGQYQPLRQQLQEALQDNDGLQQELQIVQQELNKRVSELSQTVASKQAEIQTVQSTKDSLIAAMQDEIKKNQIQVTQMADRLKLSIVDKILFPSGEADVYPNGRKVLERVGTILKKSLDKRVRVEGHTDNVPIGGQLKTLYPTNWELSAARAVYVIRFLQDQVGMDPKRLEASGMGEFHPMASNSTKEGRAQNRRIEIYLLPM
jgi:chemotaxis protein MotB